MYLNICSLCLYMYICKYMYYMYAHICINLECMRAQLYLTLCDPMDCSPPGSSVHGILQSRILEGVVISFSRGSYPKIRPVFSVSPALAGRFSTAEPPGNPHIDIYTYIHMHMHAYKYI